jgi:hypothetical protein
MAARKDPSYATAYINLACVAGLQGGADQSLLYAQHALKLAGLSDNMLSAANARIVRGIAYLQQDLARTDAALEDFLQAQKVNPILAGLNLSAMGHAPIPPLALPAAAYTSEPLPFSVDFVRQNYDQVVELPGDQGRSFLFVKKTAQWEALVIDTGQRTLAFVSTANGYDGATLKQVRVGDAGARVVGQYGPAYRHISGRQAVYHLYQQPRIIFKTDARNQVAGWVFYEVEDLFYEPSPQVVQSQPLPPASMGLAGMARKVMSGRASELRQALVIGNGAYKSTPLRNSTNDARAIAQALGETGFDVTMMLDADRRTMRQAIRDFGEDLGRGGVGLFYFAGHGLQVEGSNFLVPVDADLTRADELEDNCILASAVSGKMERAQNRVNIIILDACGDNPYAGRYRSHRPGLAGMDAAIGSLVAYATGPGKVAADGKGENGLYTAKLLKHLRTPDLNLSDLFVRVRRDVMEASGGTQVPWESSSLTGDFYFVPPAELAEEFLPFFIDMQQMAGVIGDQEFFARLATLLLESLDDERLVAGFYRFEEGNPILTFDGLLADIQKAYPDRRLLFLVDEAEILESKVNTNEFSTDVLTYMSSILENRQVSFCLTGSLGMIVIEGEHWRRLTAKGDYLEISYLSRDDTYRLIQEPVAGEVTYADGVAERIYQLTAGWPFYVQLTCFYLIVHLNQMQRNLATNEDIDAVVRAIVNNPPPQLVYQWEELEANAKIVLALVGEQSQEAQQVVDTRAIQRSIKDNKYPLDLKEEGIKVVLEELYADKHLERSEEGAYYFRVDLFRQWVRRHRSVWRLVGQNKTPLRSRLWWGVAPVALVLVAWLVWIGRDQQVAAPSVSTSLPTVGEA